MNTLSKLGLVLVAAGLAWIAGLGSDWPGWVIVGVAVILAFGPEITSKYTATKHGRLFLGEGVDGWDAGVVHLQESCTLKTRSSCSSD